MDELSRLLSSIGKKVFIEYYEEFKNEQVDKAELASRLLNENPDAVSITGQITRINCARRIFRENLQTEALEIIINSKRLDDAVIEKAKELKNAERMRREAYEGNIHG